MHPHCQVGLAMGIVVLGLDWCNAKIVAITFPISIRLQIHGLDYLGDFHPQICC